VLRPESVQGILSRQTTPGQGLISDWRAPTPLTLGCGWGYGVAVRERRVAHGVRGSTADAYWGGMADTHFVIDRERGLAAVALAQYFGADEALVGVSMREALYGRMPARSRAAPRLVPGLETP
jgi:CubicO group peptidase (beta-lactamase class C family)